MSIHNAKAAIGRLPVEIISLIFKAGHHEPSYATPESDLLYPLKISHVCRSWRAISLSAGWLWEWINPCWPRPQILTWFSRLHEHPASVWTAIYDDDERRLLHVYRSNEFSRNIVHQYPNYRALSIDIMDGDLWRTTSKEFQEKTEAETLIINFCPHPLVGAEWETMSVRHLSLEKDQGSSPTELS